MCERTYCIYWLVRALHYVSGHIGKSDRSSDASWYLNMKRELKISLMKRKKSFDNPCVFIFCLPPRHVSVCARIKDPPLLSSPIPCPIYITLSLPPPSFFLHNFILSVPDRSAAIPVVFPFKTFFCFTSLHISTNRRKNQCVASGRCSRSFS